VTEDTPRKKPKAPTPVSVEKPQLKGDRGGGMGKKQQKMVVLPTAASSRPRCNKGRKTSLNEDALVPPSDVISTNPITHEVSIHIGHQMALQNKNPHMKKDKPSKV
jgi:hypothetical protein